MARLDPGAVTDGDDGVARIKLDEFSLRLLEGALAVYQSGRVLSPEQAPPALRAACSVLDFELMRLTLDQAGWTEGALAA